jgi:hypothetical protein
VVGILVAASLPLPPRILVSEEALETLIFGGLLFRG